MQHHTLLAILATCFTLVSAAPHHWCYPPETVTITVPPESSSTSSASSYTSPTTSPTSAGSSTSSTTTTTSASTSTSAASSSTSISSSSISLSSSSTSAASFSQPTAPFTAISARSASPIHLLAITANGYNFYIGGFPATYCPNVTNLVCPPAVDATVFIGTGSLDVIVPGGQQVYVAPDGHLGYTEPHSAFVPPGSVLGYTYFKQNGSEFGDLSTNAFGATGFMACFDAAFGAYQVFASLANATVPDGNVSNCLGFDALTVDYSGPIAWEYV